MSQNTRKRLSSRKLWLFIISAIVATAYGVHGGAPLTEWGMVVGGLYGLYVGGNVGEHFAQKGEG